jgi:RNA polymerase sigma-70 factor (sigma-E family)
VTFEEYVRARGPALLRFARALTGNAHAAEDLVQEALGRAYLRWDRITRQDRPDVYLRRTVLNIHVSWWRRRSNREVPSDTASVVDQLPSTGSGGDPSDAATERDAAWREVRQLPVRQRAVIILRYYEDLDDTVISQVLGCSVPTVRTHARRALATLRSRMELTESDWETSLASWRGPS